MSHVRQQIREAAATVLTGLATTGSNVFKSRVRVLSDDDLPALIITTNSETIDDSSVDGSLLYRTLTVSVRGVAKVTAAIDDTLDTIAAEVETTLTAESLGGLVKSITLESIEIEIDDTLDRPAGSIVINFQAIYLTAPGTPGVAL